MTQQQPDALMSYTRFDDEHNGTALTIFCERLSGEVRAHTGQPFHIFQDIKDIKLGQQFEQRIDQALETTTFFIPILTPSFFKSTFCRYELERFLQREVHLGRNDLILPVYYIPVSALEDPTKRANDPLAETIAARNYIDWRKLRFESFDSPKVRRKLAEIAEEIADTLERPASAFKPVMPIVPASSPLTLNPASLQSHRQANASSIKFRSSRDKQSLHGRSIPRLSHSKQMTGLVISRLMRYSQRTVLPPNLVLILIITLLSFGILVFNLGTNLRTLRSGVYNPLGEQFWPISIPSISGIPVNKTEQVLELVQIPADPFLIGSHDGDPVADITEKSQHELTLDTYWISKTEITNTQFRAFVEGDGYSNPNYWTDSGWGWREEENIVQPLYWDDTEWNGAEQPVVGVSWFEAVAYTRWLSTQTGHEYRLPTEAEWEKAARGPNGLIWPWGNEWAVENCNCEGTIGRTVPVGSYPYGASPYGLLDMAGNVWEWTATKQGKGYPFMLEDEWTEMYLAGDFERMLRGGSWYSEQRSVRGAIRHFDDPRNRYSDVGVRLASDFLPPGRDE